MMTSLLSAIISWFVLLACLLCSSADQLSQYEYMALYDLYNSTHGDQWFWNTNTSNGIPWVFSDTADPCADNWQGISCVVDHVNVLSLPSYNLNGTIPSSIGNLSHLLQLDLSDNELTGQIPDSITSLDQVISVSLSSNALYGSIPESIGAMTLLAVLDLSNNQLDSAIPASLTTLSNLQRLYVDNNLLGGPIPSAMGDLKQLQYFICNNNGFTGSVPAGLFNLTLLQYFYLQDNQITGVLNQLLAQAINVQNLNLSGNYFTGSLPPGLGSLPQMHQLYLSHNMFTGTVPESIGQMTSLSQFDISNTAISGTLPPSMQNLSNLITLSVQNCFFKGPIEHIFGSSQTQLTAVQLDNNVFSGTLPAVLFTLPSLVSFSLVGTCITGSLPDTICDAVNLQALVMYGLTTASSCRSTGLQALSSRHSSFSSAFPACLLSLPKIQTILLSSNGLTGSMHSDWPASSTLTQLDLSHNALSGSIPDSIQNNTWALLDLSHNKLSGSLQAPLFARTNTSTAVTPQDQPQLALDTNRLSGVVPSSLDPLQNISVLAGNLFFCDSKSDLPQQDDGLDTYECASNSFNDAFYVWMGLCACAVGCVALLVVRYQYALPSVSLQISDALMSKLTDLHTVVDRYIVLNRLAGYCAMFCVLVLLPYYAIISHYKGTHTHQYAYVVSAIYVSGVVPFALNFVLFSLLLAVLYFRISTKHFTAKVLPTYPDGDTALRRLCVWIVYAAINTGVVVGVNIGYVNIILFGSSQGLVPAQIALSIFKLVWGTVASPFMIRQLGMLFFPTRTDNSESFFVLQLIVALFNNIAIPCLVVAAIDPNCFSDILRPPGAQDVTYLLPVCYSPVIEQQCTSFVFQSSTLTFTPPFVYSYQCSASFITSYAPAFVYMSISTVFLNPLMQFILYKLYHRWQATGGPLFVAVSVVLPRILKPPPQEVPHSSDVRLRPYVGAVGTMINILTQLGILLTFGVIFPPVALAMAVSISAVVCASQLKVKWFVDSVVQTDLLGYLDLINAECAGVGTTDQMLYSVEIIICYCCAFYMLFQFDALGDTQGFEACIWVLIVVPLAPYAVFAFLKLCSAIYLRSGGREGENTVSSVTGKQLDRAGNSGGGVAGVELYTVSGLHDNSA